MAGPILAITDGTTRIDLINPKIPSGIEVKDWRPRTPENVGTFRESPLTGERKLSQWRFQNATETFDHDLSAYTEDDLIAILQDTRRLLVKGLNYYVSLWINKPVWIEAKASNETEIRYALVKFFQSPDDENPLDNAFISTKKKKSLMTNMALVIERGHWLSNQPGTGDEVEISNVVEWAYNGIDTTNMGAEVDSDGILFISNKYPISNLTHIKIFDASGSSYTNILPISSFPKNLYPNPPAVGDILYFIIDDSISGTQEAWPFSSLIFDIGTALSGNPTITWEYYNGAAWTTLIVQDHTFNFTVTGVNGVFWEIPSGMANTVNINGSLGGIVRARITALTGTVSPPTQVNRQIYAANVPYFETEDVLGDMPALARFKLTNVSDSNSLELHSNRVVCGLRSTSRGDNFSAYLNIAPTFYIPVDVTVDTGTDTTFFVGFNPRTPANGYAQYTSSNLDGSPITRVSFTFVNNVRDYYGTYHVFLRMYQTNGDAGDIEIRLKVITGSGGSPFYSRIVSPKADNDWEVIDLDAITLGGNSINFDEICDQTSIEIQLANVSNVSRTVYFYDLILIPTDEWIGDFTDKTNNGNSIIGYFNDDKHLIDIDSITNLRKQGRSVIRNEDDYISSIYEYSTNGHAMLQANSTQRLWVFSMSYGISNTWVSYPEVAWNIQVYKNQRYLSMRGSR
jgi:hypothetical protein